ncbi:TPA: hypothetical protein NGS41_003943 [Vibrio parahaemolyticus]|nr:hypothetical protein [Vibrio parahaemolyticus]
MSDTALIALITGISAIIGSLIPQIFVLRKEANNKEHARLVLLREKYEELAGLIQQSEHWCSSLFKCKSISDLHEYNIFEPQRKALVLALIYFPEFKEQLKELGLEYAKYYSKHGERFKTPHKPTTIDDLSVVLVLEGLRSLLEKNKVQYIKA